MLRGRASFKVVIAASEGAEVAISGEPQLAAPSSFRRKCCGVGRVERQPTRAKRPPVVTVVHLCQDTLQTAAGALVLRTRPAAGPLPFERVTRRPVFGLPPLCLEASATNQQERDEQRDDQLGGSSRHVCSELQKLAHLRIAAAKRDQVAVIMVMPYGGRPVFMFENPPRVVSTNLHAEVTRAENVKD